MLPAVGVLVAGGGYLGWFGGLGWRFQEVMAVAWAFIFAGMTSAAAGIAMGWMGRRFA